MKGLYKFFLSGLLGMITLFCFMGSFTAVAVPAMPGFVELYQPDGTSFLATMQGDEWFHWLETPEKNVVLRNNSSGYYEYGKIVYQNGSPALTVSGEIYYEPVVITDEHGRLMQAYPPPVPTVDIDLLKTIRNNKIREKQELLRRIRENLIQTRQ